jgi:hypothetical protein
MSAQDALAACRRTNQGGSSGRRPRDRIGLRAVAPEPATRTAAPDDEEDLRDLAIRSGSRVRGVAQSDTLA